jgi:endonuclease YncB( thermonuclease family)
MRALPCGTKISRLTYDVMRTLLESELTMSIIRKIITFVVAAIVACSNPTSARDSRKQPQQPSAQRPAPGLEIGELRLTKVTDGDTIRVDGLDASLRLLGFDAEETFKSQADRRAFEAGWQTYAQAKRGSSPRPVKFATPLGEQAKEFAKHFFEGVDKVRLERDHPSEIRDRYNRYLAYVFAKKNGQWVNYNVEAVRAGMAPYFPKYGQSRRFHREFIAAEEEAKQHQLGIWAPDAMSYPDYPEREAWWAARGEFVAQFRTESEADTNYVDISHADALDRLEALVGKTVVVLGIVDEVYLGDHAKASERAPTRVTLGRQLGSDFPLIFFDKAVFETSGIAAWKGEFVTVTGVPSIYENKHTHAKQLEIVIDRASQIRLSPVPPSAAVVP